MRKFKKIVHYIMSLPKTIYFNFKYFSFKDAVKLPIYVSNRVFLDKLHGNVTIDGNIKTGMIKIGFTEPCLFDFKKQRTIWSIEGQVVFKGKAIIGSGSKLCIDRPTGKIVFGENFVITANTQIWSRKKITFGKNNLISWDNIIMDTDSHSIYDKNSNLKLNEDKEIVFGDNVWIGCRCTILKGSKIGNDTVISANTLLSKDYSEKHNIVLGGSPVVEKKSNLYWTI